MLKIIESIPVIGLKSRVFLSTRDPIRIFRLALRQHVRVNVCNSSLVASNRARLCTHRETSGALTRLVNLTPRRTRGAEPAAVFHQNEYIHASLSHEISTSTTSFVSGRLASVYLSRVARTHRC